MVFDPVQHEVGGEAAGPGFGPGAAGTVGSWAEWATRVFCAWADDRGVEAVPPGPGENAGVGWFRTQRGQRTRYETVRSVRLTATSLTMIVPSPGRTKHA